MSNSTCCCGSEAQNTQNTQCCSGNENPSKLSNEKWITGFTECGGKKIPIVATKLSFSDTFGSWKARWNINRMDYKINPGLYGVGSPDETSPVLVTANYKTSFDRLRRELTEIHAWIMVLDTMGINVWCAAGKGTFGTNELVQRISAVKLHKVVIHKNIILPQLGAAGVSANEVLKKSGFHVIYGSVRAKDINDFLSSGQKATPAMQRVNFTMLDRLVLTPIEVTGVLKPILILFGVLFLLNAAGLGHYGFGDMVSWLGTIFIGCVLTPVLLPWIPGRALSFKGFLLGILWAAAAAFLFGWFSAQGLLKAIAYLLLLPAFSAFISMNFTGATTYTSLSGVDKEMKIALPLMILACLGGIVLLVVHDIIIITA